MIAFWHILRRAAAQWITHSDARFGAALAYYAVFSLGPIIVIATAVAGLVFGRAGVREEVAKAIQGLIGPTGAQALDAMLAAADKPKSGAIATAVGIITLVIAAVGVVVQLKDALNAVWEVVPRPGGGLWQFARSYVLSLACVLALGFLLLVSMIVTAVLSAAGNLFEPYFHQYALQIINSCSSILVSALFFAAMFKWLPDVPIDWRDVWEGAILTALLFEVGKAVIGLYIGNLGLETTYGATASIVVVLIWVYYSSQIMLFGAEFTNVVAKVRGSIARRGPDAA